NPAARGLAGKKPGAWLAGGAESRLNERNQFADQRVAIRAIVIGVDVVRVAEGARAIELKHDHLGRFVRQPRFCKPGFGFHQVENGGVAGVEPPDMYPERKTPKRLAVVIARQNHPGAEADWPAMKLAQQRGLNLDELDQPRVGGQVLWR